MTHYAVIVFDNGANVDELIAKYNEQVEVAPYVKGKVTVDEWRNFLNHYLADVKPYDNENPINNKTLEELYAEHGDNWDGNNWKKNSDGVWEVWSTYNPNSKYDYYSVEEILSKSKLPKWTPFSFVTPDGVWHSKGVMGWWACSWDEKPDDVWDKEYRDAVAEYKGLFCLLDCHI